jgi:hypothetical protein
MPETAVHFQIRMHQYMNEFLASRARAEKSSLNALIVSLLSEAVGRRDAPTTLTSGRTVSSLSSPRSRRSSTLRSVDVDDGTGVSRHGPFGRRWHLRRPFPRERMASP